jgi:hypothetical protein
MRTIDLPETSKGALCNLCGDEGQHKLAEVMDHEIGPVCLDCFPHCLAALREIRRTCLTQTTKKP